jgi:hypothetical protein
MYKAVRKRSRMDHQKITNLQSHMILEVFWFEKIAGIYIKSLNTINY